MQKCCLVVQNDISSAFSTLDSVNQLKDIKFTFCPLSYELKQLAILFFKNTFIFPRFVAFMPHRNGLLGYTDF